MPKPENITDPHNLKRFTKAQEPVYNNVLAELNKGKKRTHWMWFIFPQLKGLGHSATARLYAIKNLDEAQRYLRDPVLGARLHECSTIVLGIKDHSIEEAFGFPDYLKLKSSMTLFSCATDYDPVFNKVLARHFNGEPDTQTFELLDRC